MVKNKQCCRPCREFADKLNQYLHLQHQYSPIVPVSPVDHTSRWPVHRRLAAESAASPRHLRLRHAALDARRQLRGVQRRSGRQRVRWHPGAGAAEDASHAETTGLGFSTVTWWEWDALGIDRWLEIDDDLNVKFDYDSWWFMIIYDDWDEVQKVMEKQRGLESGVEWIFVFSWLGILRQEVTRSVSGCFVRQNLRRVSVYRLQPIGQLDQDNPFRVSSGWVFHFSRGEGMIILDSHPHPQSDIFFFYILSTSNDV